MTDNRKRISIRLSEAELRAIEAAAERDHLPYTTWIRQAALKAAEKSTG